MTVRTATVTRSNLRPTHNEVAAYLPSGYKVVEFTDERIVIKGEDYAGWTLDGYVIPRLASGLIYAREIDAE